MLSLLGVVEGVFGGKTVILKEIALDGRLRGFIESHTHTNSGAAILVGSVLGVVEVTSHLKGGLEDSLRHTHTNTGAAILVGSIFRVIRRKV